MGANPKSNLGGNQILQKVYDEPTDRLRVDASITTTIGEVQVEGEGPSPSTIQITDGTDRLNINPDGTINVNVSIDGADGDNIIAVGTEDGSFSGTQRPLQIGSDGNLRVQDEELLNKFVNGNDIGDVTINNTTLNPIPVSLQPVSNLDIRDIQASQDNILIAGTENGLSSGTVRFDVNNLRQQILKTHDRNQIITYADFGTKDQRITQIDYSSPTFPGIVARKNITYTLVGTRYRRDNIIWSIV